MAGRDTDIPQTIYCSILVNIISGYLSFNTSKIVEVPVIFVLLNYPVTSCLVYLFVIFVLPWLSGSLAKSKHAPRNKLYTNAFQITTFTDTLLQTWRLSRCYRQRSRIVSGLQMVCNLSGNCNGLLKNIQVHCTQTNNRILVNIVSGVKDL